MQKRPTISKSLLLTSASLYICSCIRIIQMYIYIYTVHCYRCPCTLKPTHTHTHTHTHLLWAAAKNIYDLFTCVQDSTFHVSVELFFEKRRACMRWQCFPGSFAECRLFRRALVQKRPTISRSLLLTCVCGGNAFQALLHFFCHKACFQNALLQTSSHIYMVWQFVSIFSL